MKRRGRSDIRVAGAHAEILYAAALDAAWLSGRAIRVGLVAVLLGDFAIVARVAVDEDAGHAELLRALDLETAEDAAVLGNGNLALEVDTGAEDILVVEICAVVDVDVLGGDVAAGRVAVEGRDAVLGVGGGVVLEDVLGQGGLEGDIPGVGVTLGLLQQRKAVVNGVVDVDVVGGDAGVEAPGLPLLASPLGLDIGKTAG